MKADALEKLLSRQKVIEARIAGEKAKLDRHKYKEQARLRAIIAAAILADNNSETKLFVLGVLKRHVTAERDVEFLKANNFWEGEKTNVEEKRTAAEVSRSKTANPDTAAKLAEAVHLRS